MTPRRASRADRRSPVVVARTWAVVVIASASLAACGIDADDSPRRIPPGALPDQLLDAGTTTTIDTETVDRIIYLVLTDSPRLATLASPVPANQGNPFSATLSALVAAQPARDELLNRIPKDTVVLGADLDPVTGLLTVNLSSAMQDIEGDLQVQAFAQLVFTATEFPTVTRGVRFLIEGQARATPVQGGIKPANETVTRSDYRSFDPTLPTTTSTTRPPETTTTDQP